MQIVPKYREVTIQLIGNQNQTLPTSTRHTNNRPEIYLNFRLISPYNFYRNGLKVKFAMKIYPKIGV